MGSANLQYTSGERAAATLLKVYSFGVVFFLVAPILIIIPLSFNAEPYFTITSGMLRLDASAFSLRWYQDIFENGMADPTLPKWSWSWLADSWRNAQWIHSAKNSVIIALGSTVLATVLGTLAALGMTQTNLPGRKLIMAIFVSPMIVPLIISAAGLFFLFSELKLTGTYTGLIIAHTVLGVPFVIITVAATLQGFDMNLVRAGLSLGSSRTGVFWRVVLPIISPGVVSGALFAFVTSFDEVVLVIFLADNEQRTIPRQMWSGIREQISPTILAVATVLVCVSIALLTSVELLRRRSERLRGLKPL